MLNDESYYIIEGAIEAPEGIQVDMIIDRVLWRPGQIVNDSILDREQAFLSNYAHQWPNEI